jgi:hypothetical protein
VKAEAGGRPEPKWWFSTSKARERAIDGQHAKKHENPDSQSGLNLSTETLSLKHLKDNSDGRIVKRFYIVE